jgi:AcrR family transcriptional regulator
MPPSVKHRLDERGRRAAILKAAAELFFEQGYAATSIDSIIERAGGSKRSIYEAFGNKEGLFSALVAENVGEALAALDPASAKQGNLREVLAEFGRRLIAIQTSPTVIGLYRAIAVEATRFPDLARMFYETGPGLAADRLSHVLEEARARGEIRGADCRLLANHFIAMMRDNLHLQVLLGLRSPPAAEEIHAIASSAVETFLQGIGTGD